MKLTQEDKEVLRDLATSDMWKAIENYCRVIVYNHEQALLNFNAAPGDNMLFMLKARLDGAKSVLSGIENVKRLLKEKK